jgi:hypothetical protein
MSMNPWITWFARGRFEISQVAALANARKLGGLHDALDLSRGALCRDWGTRRLSVPSITVTTVLFLRHRPLNSGRAHEPVNPAGDADLSGARHPRGGGASVGATRIGPDRDLMTRAAFETAPAVYRRASIQRSPAFPYFAAEQVGGRE